MVKLYTNRELAEKLGINLAKWKRWSREFLPPDPLGGMQSGFARQYYFSDAFNVMLGGHLVGDLHFSVYEAGRIIGDLKDWLKERGFYQFPNESVDGRLLDSNITNYKIYIQSNFKSKKEKTVFTYRLRGIISNKPVLHNGIEAREERYVETVIGAANSKAVVGSLTVEKILKISGLYTYFVGKLGYEKK